IVFISSSTESLPLAEVVANNLRYVADTVIWDEGPFHLSQGSLSALDEAADRVDFAVVLLTPDDVVTKRGQTYPAARDNTLFELGFFMGRLGIDHVFMIYDRGSGLLLPSNLAGITAATYAARPDGDLEAALGPPSTQVVQAIRRELAGGAP
ncbi:MAG: nucleotide-binding protein, partial [Chloroflexota bacterium]